MNLTDQQRLDWLRLIRSEQIGPRTFRGLINQYGSAADALEALPDLARRSGRLKIKVASKADVEREMDKALRMGARFVASGEPDYPVALRAINDAPPLIAMRGNIAALKQPIVAIVGSRNASALGLKFTATLAQDLGAAGFTIASGLARGVDTSAHKVTLTTGTVAVLAGGHDRIYPSQNVPLLDALLEQGVAISEMPFGWEPRGRDFPRRNRIVSGLSLGVVIIEAARRSGSLITARFGLEQGREIFAVPGSPLDPRCEGTNGLIRQGATLCTSAADVVSVLTPLVGSLPAPKDGFNESLDETASAPLWDELDLPEINIDRASVPNVSIAMNDDDDQQSPNAASSEMLANNTNGATKARVIDLLGMSPTSIDDLARSSGLHLRDLQLILVELELSGRLDRHAGGAVSLVP
jgi:DNA processing protein